MASTILDQGVKSLFRLNNFQESALIKLGIITVKDLLYHFPLRYEYYSSAKLIRDCMPGETVTIYGKIKNLKTGKAFKSHVPKAEGVVEDNSGSIKVIWLHQAYIAKMIQPESLVKIHGKVTERNGSLGMMNPEIEAVSALPQTIGDDLFSDSASGEEGENSEGGKNGPGGNTGLHFNTPVYAESRGITSRWFFHAVQKILKNPEFAGIADPIPEDIRKRYNLPGLQSALIWIHTPKKDAYAEVARKRFAFEEIFYIQLKNEQLRMQHREEQSFIIKDKEESEGIKNFISKLGFDMTEGQKRSIGDILNDFSKGHPMSRLLEGDVGSGKTAVAAVTTWFRHGLRARISALCRWLTWRQPKFWPASILNLS